MEAVASQRNVAIAPRKVRLLADLIRGEYVDDALDQLALTHKAGSPVIMKLINSAVANMLDNSSDVDETMLYVKMIFVDDGIVRKWIRPRSRGIANRTLRRKCHIKVVVSEWSEEE